MAPRWAAVYLLVAGARRAAPEVPGAMSLQKLKVTVVTDQRKMLRHVSQLLAALGYEVRSVANPAQASTLLETSDTDFLVVDSEPSISTAIHWCREACRHDRPKYFYSLLMVENPEPNDLKEALEAGIDDFLCKPIRHVEVLVRLRAGAGSWSSSGGSASSTAWTDPRD